MRWGLWQEVASDAVAAVAPARAGETRSSAGRSSRMRRRAAAVAPAAASSSTGDAQLVMDLEIVRVTI
jgi:hypothetical protein